MSSYPKAALSEIQAMKPGFVIHVGGFEGNSTPTDLTVSPRFKGVTGTTRTGVGVHTFTIPGTGPINLVSALVSVADTNTFGTISVNETTRVCTLKFWSIEAAAPAAAAELTTNSFVDVFIVEEQ